MHDPGDPGTRNPDEILNHVNDAFDRSVALILGVGQAYREGIPKLRTPVDDARAIADVLKQHHDFAVIMRLDDEVMARSLRDLLSTGLAEELGRPLGERDRLLVYFAGHGVSRRSERGPAGQLLLADADPAHPDSYFDMSELCALLGALPCRHLLLVLDCCFAGAIRWTRASTRDVGLPVYRESLSRFVSQRAWQVLVSASHEQRAIDSIGTRLETAANSPFAAALLRCLRGEGDYVKDNLIIANELELYVSSEVARETGQQQTPQLFPLEQHGSGEFVFQVPGSRLDLAPAPVLSLAACPYPGPRAYDADDRKWFFGRTRVVQQLVRRVEDSSLTVVLGGRGTGKSSLLAAGLVPALRAKSRWTVLEQTWLEDLCELPGENVPIATAIARWFAMHPGEHLCIVLDHFEDLQMISSAREHVLTELVRALRDGREQLRVVLAPRAEPKRAMRDTALRSIWTPAIFMVPPLTQDELREAIELPARSVELSFDPSALVDTLINEAAEARSAMSLLSSVLCELYMRCAQRGTDRLLTERDYDEIGRLRGVMIRRADAQLERLVARHPAYATTVRNVFMRMVTYRQGLRWRAPVSRSALVYESDDENARVGELLRTFDDAHLLVLDDDTCEPVHDALVRDWHPFAAWYRTLDDAALDLQRDLAAAAEPWAADPRREHLWRDRARVERADAEPWLNATERAFVAACKSRRPLSLRPYLWFAALVVTALALALAAGEPTDLAATLRAALGATP